MKHLIFLVSMLVCFTAQAGHEMQHGFILEKTDQFASHLVANGHHSRQVEVMGELILNSAEDRELYKNLKLNNTGEKFYFLLQAQQVDLASLKGPAMLKGPIIQSEVGQYQPKNIVIPSATFRVDRVIVNVENPFFKEE